MLFPKRLSAIGEAKCFRTGVLSLVKRGGEVSMSLLWGGRGDVVPLLIMGLIALHISVVCWFVVRRFKTKKVS